MTTPRDDIAGLIERLIKQVTESAFSTGDVLCDEAATQLAALSARVKELEGEKALGWVETINNENDQHAHKWQARALRAEQERDEAYERAANVAEDFTEPTDIGRRHLRKIKGERLAEHLQAQRIAAAIRRLTSGPEKEKKE